MIFEPECFLWEKPTKVLLAAENEKCSICYKENDYNSCRPIRKLSLAQSRRALTSAECKALGALPIELILLFALDYIR